MDKQVKQVHAGCSMITPHIARVAIIGTGRKPETVRMHPAQVCAISMLFEAVAVENVQELHSLEDIDAVRHLASEYQPSTFMGMKIEQDAGMPESEIQFLDAEGAVISRVTSLAIPMGFQV